MDWIPLRLVPSSLEHGWSRRGRGEEEEEEEEEEEKEEVDEKK